MVVVAVESLPAVSVSVTVKLIYPVAVEATATEKYPLVHVPVVVAVPLATVMVAWLQAPVMVTGDGSVAPADGEVMVTEVTGAPVSVMTIVAVELLETLPAASAWVTVAVQEPSLRLLVVIYQFKPDVVV